MNVVVLDHHLDAEAGVYRLVFGTPVVTEITNPDFDPEILGPDAPPPTIPNTVYEGIADVTWDADDPRWFGDHGRRPAEEIAAEQRAELRAAFEDREERAAPSSSPDPMPGIGEAL